MLWLKQDTETNAFTWHLLSIAIKSNRASSREEGEFTVHLPRKAYQVINGCNVLKYLRFNLSETLPMVFLILISSYTNFWTCFEYLTQGHSIENKYFTFFRVRMAICRLRVTLSLRGILRRQSLANFYRQKRPYCTNASSVNEWKWILIGEMKGAV